MNGIKYGRGTDGGRRSFLKFTGLATATALAGMDSAQGCSEQACRDGRGCVAKLPRVKQKMVAPPFLPEHEQVATDRTEDRRGHADHRRKEDGDRRRRHGSSGR